MHDISTGHTWYGWSAQYGGEGYRGENGEVTGAGHRGTLCNMLWSLNAHVHSKITTQDYDNKTKILNFSRESNL